MRVLITGGAGFIGSHLADHYVAKSDQVTILDNFFTGAKENIAHLEGKITTQDGDIRNVDLVEKLTKDADLVLHMAAALGVNNILENPIESISTNFHGSEIVLNAAVKYDKRIVIAVRGTELTDKTDLAADGLAVIGKLRNSERWKKDEAKIREVQEFPEVLVSKLE